MENLEIKNTALYRTIECTIKDMLKRNIDDVLDSVMPIFEPFIRERLNQYEEYRKLQVTATAPITLVNNEALDKFKTLQHITGDMKSTVEDWGYTPNLYHFDGSWHVDWIHCEDGDSIKGFDADTPEEAIDKAYNWFTQRFVMHNEEEWRDCEFYPNYAVSDQGNVVRKKDGLLLKQYLQKSGYVYVWVDRGFGRHSVPVHRLVAIAFHGIEGYKNGLFVDHINTIRSDNRACNLRWVTPKENANNPLTLENKKRKKDG